MASKIILDSPDILEETLLTLTEACRHFPVRCSRPALERWLRKGSRGVVLESVLLCGRRYTSKEAIHRFVRDQLQVEPDKASTPMQRSLSRKAIAAASLRFGLPEPQGKDVAPMPSDNK